MRNISNGFHNWNYIFTFATIMYYWFHHSFYLAKALPFIGGWLADRLLGNLYVYEGAEHLQQAQNPKPIDINLYK